MNLDFKFQIVQLLFYEKSFFSLFLKFYIQIVDLTVFLFNFILLLYTLFVKFI